MSRILLFSFIAFLIHGCKSDNLEGLHPVCDTTGTVSFLNDIKPILIANCGSSDNDCHNTDASLSGYGLATYDEVIATIINSGVFLKTIKHDPSISSSKWMPQNTTSKINDCSIQKIEAWLNRGSQDN